MSVLREEAALMGVCIAAYCPAHRQWIDLGKGADFWALKLWEAVKLTGPWHGEEVRIINDAHSLDEWQWEIVGDSFGDPKNPKGPCEEILKDWVVPRPCPLSSVLGHP